MSQQGHLIGHRSGRHQVHSHHPDPLKTQQNISAATNTNATTTTASSSSLGKNDLLDGVGKVRFLLEMSTRLEQDGNLPESIQAAESALLLRRELTDEDQSLFPTSLQRQAQELVMRCNALGVSSFQKDQYAAASFLLEKALLLTDENPTMHTFASHEHDRLRLRAATYNNVGCMEKRRSNYEVALKNLQQAVELETLVDPDVGAGPSTYLNMCTILNKMGDFIQAINAADRALRAAVLQQQQGREISPQFVHLIVMAHYNRGVALEFAGRPGDVAKAHDSYMQAVRTADRFGPSNMSAGSESVKEAAIQAIRRLDQQPALAFGLERSSAATLSLSASGGGGSPAKIPGSPLSQQSQQQQSLTGRSMDLATARLLAQMTPLPPPGAIPVVTASTDLSASQNIGDGQVGGEQQQQAGVGRAPGSAPLPAASSVTAGLGITSGNVRNKFAGSRNAAAAAAAASSSGRYGRAGTRSMNARNRKQEYDARLENAVKKAKAAHQKERSDKHRREQEAAVKKREEEARALYRRTEATLRNERISKLHSAAIKLQRLWRGYYARDMITSMAESAIKIQAVFRSHRCRVMLAQLQVAKQEEDQRQQALDEKTEACTLIMRPIRRFLRICDTWRKLHALRLQRKYSARKIQRAFREYRIRCEEEFLNRVASEKKAHEEKMRRHNASARRIQYMFRAWKSKKLMRVVRAEQTRRNAAATKVQALIRGFLTRVWYRHFIVYRRQQMLSTAASLRKISKIQAVWRGAIARRLYRRLATEKRINDREEKRFISARRLQCFWRCVVARIRFGSLKYQASRRHAAATKIQSAFRGFVARKAYKQRQQEERRLRATRVIQQWYRDMRLRRKNIREARWAAERRSEEKRLLRRTGNAMTIQTWSRFALARASFSKALDHFLYRQQHGLVIQRFGRGHLGRKDIATTKRIAWLVDMQEKKHKQMTNAAKIIQRNVRSFLAKSLLEKFRREFNGAAVIQSYSRGRRSFDHVLFTMRSQRLEEADTAARKIQKSVRLWIQRKHLLELEKYYLMIRRNKLIQMRREEAATQVQSVYRGHGARKLAKREKQRGVQRTIDAVTIQRWFRRRRFRLSINQEFTRRRHIRALRNKAATKIQSFWRRILAEEYVAVIRERKYYKTIAAIVLQCFWRIIRAKRIARDKREARKKFQELCHERQEALEYGVRLVSAFLRSRYDGWKCLAERERVLAGQLERKVMATYLLRNAAATKIQALYRGCYERVYVRGLRAEHAVQKQIQEDTKTQHDAAAGCIQRAVRCWLARKTYAGLLHDKREHELQQRLDYEEQADPQSLVQQLFWVQEALTKKNIALERKERLAKAHVAAIKIQAIARGYIVRRRRARLQYEKRAESVAIIGDSHDLTEQEAMALRASQEEASIKIQKVARGFIERTRWREYKRQILVDAQESTADVEVRDAAATRIQSLRRGYVARVHTSNLRRNIEEEKEEKQMHEAAAMIQRNWRAHHQRVQSRQPKLVADTNRPHYDNVGTIQTRSGGVVGGAGGGGRTFATTPANSSGASLGSGSTGNNNNDNYNNNMIAPAPPPRRATVAGDSSINIDSASAAAASVAAAASSSSSSTVAHAPAPPSSNAPTGRFQRATRSKPL